MRAQRAMVALASLGVFGLAACGPRRAEVRTAPSTATQEAAIHLTNNLAQAVNVYVVQMDGTEMFVRQVAANTTEQLPVRGVAPGTQVRLRAVTVDGKSTFTTENPVTLTSTFRWNVP
ncbi:MAG TPA: hypothetical protein VJU87_07350 [Gemmatimonadaceae bacterium]|nr:hypothetical protein [Gemmatimonadaceae bacterium]